MTDRNPDCSFCPCFAGWVDENDPYNVPGVLRNYDDKPVCEDCYRNEPFYVNVYEVTSLAEWYGPDLLFVSITKLGDA